MDLGRFELCLKVANIVASRDFYEKLGFVVSGGNQAEGWLQMANPSVRIALYQGHVPANLLNFRGQDVFALAQDLAAKGVKFDKAAEIEEDGSAGAWLRDPDGNLIYLNTFPGETIEGSV